MFYITGNKNVNFYGILKYEKVKKKAQDKK